MKSTAGEALQTVEVDQRGLLRDRGWAVYTADGGIASGKTSRRFRKIDGLMKWRSTAPADSNDVPQLHSPRGSSYSVDDPRAAEALTHNFGQPLTLRPERSMSHYDDCPIPGTHRRLEEAHRLWHRAAEAYEDPDEFRTQGQLAHLVDALEHAFVAVVDGAADL